MRKSRETTKLVLSRADFLFRVISEGLQVLYIWVLSRARNNLK